MKLKTGGIDNSDSWMGALSDIAFLLIIFFILTASFGMIRFLPIIFERQAAGASREIATKDMHSILIISNEKVRIDETTYSMATFGKELQQEAYYTLTAEPEIHYSTLLSVLEILSELQIKNIRFKESA